MLRTPRDDTARDDTVQSVYTTVLWNSAKTNSFFGGETHGEARRQDLDRRGPAQGEQGRRGVQEARFEAQAASIAAPEGEGEGGQEEHKGQAYAAGRAEEVQARLPAGPGHHRRSRRRGQGQRGQAREGWHQVGQGAPGQGSGSGSPGRSDPGGRQPGHGAQGARGSQGSRDDRAGAAQEREGGWLEAEGGGQAGARYVRDRDQGCAEEGPHPRGPAPGQGPGAQEDLRQAGGGHPQEGAGQDGRGHSDNQRRPFAAVAQGGLCEVSASYRPEPPHVGGLHHPHQQPADRARERGHEGRDPGGRAGAGRGEEPQPAATVRRARLRLQGRRREPEDHRRSEVRLRHHGAGGRLRLRCHRGPGRDRRQRQG